MADFQEHHAKFEEKGIRVIAASVDPVDKAAEIVEKHGFAYPVGWGLDPVAVSGLTGAFYEADKGFLHAAGFIVDPKGKVVNAVYSTGSIGRLTAGDCLGKIVFEMGG